MNANRLTDALARQVMQWNVGVDRFHLGNRSWIPKWRFQPLTNVADAFLLLDTVAAEDFLMTAKANGKFLVRVQIAGVCGDSHDESKPRAMTLAIAQAVGIDMGDLAKHDISSKRASKNGIKANA